MFLFVFFFFFSSFSCTSFFLQTGRGREGVIREELGGWSNGGLRRTGVNTYECYTVMYMKLTECFFCEMALTVWLLDCLPTLSPIFIQVGISLRLPKEKRRDA